MKNNLNMKIQKIRKKQNRSIKKLGEEFYGFYQEEEKRIYMYLCRKRLTKKEIEKIDSNLKFETYEEWVQYINHKYEKFSNEKLLEFSYFLNQNMRNIKPGHEYLNIVIPAMVTLIFDALFDIIVETPNIPIHSAIEFLIEIIVIIGFLFLGQYIMSEVSKHIWDNVDGENFYLDYKEIIDRMIEKRHS